MTSIEKKMLVAVAGLTFCVMLMVNMIGNQIEDAGGVRSIIVEAGKEVKAISKEIDKE